MEMRRFPGSRYALDARVSIFSVLQRQLAFCRLVRQRLAPHDVCHKRLKRGVSFGAFSARFVLRQGRQEDAESIDRAQGGMRLEESAYEGIALKEGIAPLQERLKFFDVQRLQVSTDVKDGIARVRPHRFDRVPRPKVIVLPIDFTRPRRTAVEQHELREPAPDLGVESRQRFLERTLADA
jgi:hypothetical protein